MKFQSVVLCMVELWQPVFDKAIQIKIDLMWENTWSISYE